MNSAIYKGPIASSLGGVDIAWVVGLLVAGALYYVLERGNAVASSAETDAETLVETAPAHTAPA